MKATTRILITALSALGVALLGGCASHPELRPYTAQETLQLQLEALQRQGLSMDEYEQRRRVILRAATPQAVTEVTGAQPAISG
ncbi:hypothetical protein C4Q28_11575 [Pseudomonas sp. SWI6]|uniref:Lipoprotein n=1 Tax=Pseudomonas taiwanensis TaxID=470150 RepID=A0ABR6V153_9PSED|nr:MULTISPECIES: lipoprotein [Pseudomonas]AGZ35805.1 lipoprotein [Pseudomonas sp. VLB120]AVD82748.1 hypothetical protein C4Q28_11575 [Pseudomonas sp. SWI6]AVD89704.1 hypothetical protein C4Q26_22280 [Pseudomonas sp. SWI44]MBC3474241.1 hypothetical protein [Pseudomonas taiwanensis]MBC3491848.1 hypothetical protein [Pseudomonas taiwanensis]